MSDNIIYPNTKSSNILKFDSLNTKEVKKLFLFIADEIHEAFCCYYISGSLYDEIGYRYFRKPNSNIKLENKWYIYAIDAFEKRLELILDKLYDSQKNNYSIFNILNHFAIEKNLNKICNTQQKKSLFLSLLKTYNNKCLIFRKKLMDRRNNFNVHIGNRIFDENFKENLIFGTQECLELLCYARNTLCELYQFMFDEILSISSEFEGELHYQIKKFISNLNDKGNLE